MNQVRSTRINTLSTNAGNAAQTTEPKADRLPLLLTNPFADTVMTRTHTAAGFSDSSAYLLLAFVQRIYSIKLTIIFYVTKKHLSSIFLNFVDSVQLRACRYSHNHIFIQTLCLMIFGRFYS